jgi:3-oxo-5-alpha-steroid 4-dehydrogenase 3
MRPWMFLPHDTNLSLPQAFLSSSIPPIRKRFAEYGSRAEETSMKKPRDSQDAGHDSKEDSTRTMLRAISVKVPHRYFTHFYMVSFMSSLFWAFQFLTFGRPLRLILDLQSASQSSDTPSMSRNQIILVWAMMSVQGARRCYESVVFARSSRSEMWIALYGVGISFYLATGMAIWIEGTGMLNGIQIPLHK